MRVMSAVPSRLVDVALEALVEVVLERPQLVGGAHRRLVQRRQQGRLVQRLVDFGEVDGVDGGLDARHARRQRRALRAAAAPRRARGSLRRQRRDRGGEGVELGEHGGERGFDAVQLGLHRGGVGPGDVGEEEVDPVELCAGLGADGGDARVKRLVEEARRRLGEIAHHGQQVVHLAPDLVGGEEAATRKPNEDHHANHVAGQGTEAGGRGVGLGGVLPAAVVAAAAADAATPAEEEHAPEDKEGHDDAQREHDHGKVEVGAEKC
mmetsp:Transcript_21302/g.46383  ORF Transcript_21302/g.46383 Transcript_21302/m.46383 type:complete len:265 (-) Transcript_21302:425-1219(-)